MMNNRTGVNDLARQIKERLTIRAVAEYYGFTPNRAGFIQCPFHAGDHTASLKLYDGDDGWHCFGCNKGGSVIDFVMELFDINFRQACVRLNGDFGLCLVPGAQPSRRERSALVEARRRAAEEQAAKEAERRQMAEEHRYWWEAAKYFAPDDLCGKLGYIHPLYAEALKRLPYLEYRLNEHMSD